MKCFVCDAGTLNRRMALVEGQVKRKKYTVDTWALVCDHCGHVSVEGEDMPEFMRAVADEYRRAHKLLTSQEIRQIRGGLSQQKFAQELGVGVASVKRWELGLIQDRSSNRLILEFTRRRNQTWTYEVVLSHAPSSEAFSLAVGGLEGLANGPPAFRSAQISSLSCHFSDIMIISQEQEDISRAIKLQKKCELRRVALRESHASAEGTQDASIGPFSLRISHNSTANAVVERVLRVQVRLNVECYEGAEPPSLFFNIQCTFDLDYEVEDGFDPPEESIAAFKDGNAIFNCWPYAREFVQSMTSRMGLTPPPIPLLRLVPKDKPAKTNEPSHSQPTVKTKE